MPVCVAFGCNNRSTNKAKQQLKLEGGGSKITFHKFPKDPVLHKKWIEAIDRKNWSPTVCSCVCSLHFKEADMDRTSLVCVRLRKGAVPTIFSNIPLYLPTWNSTAATAASFFLVENTEALNVIKEEPIYTDPKFSSHLQKLTQLKSEPCELAPVHNPMEEQPFIYTRSKNDLMRQTFEIEEQSYKRTIKSLQDTYLRNRKTITMLTNILLELMNKYSNIKYLPP